MAHAPTLPSAIGTSYRCAMPFAITLRLDASSAPSIAALWEALADAGIDTDRRALGYPPHVTLAVYGDDAPVEALRAALQDLADGWRALPVAFAGIGIFPAPSPILWLAPVPTQALLARHAALLAALPALTPDPHYAACRWTSHVTLSGALRDPAAALQTVLPIWQPTPGLLACAELVKFRPVKVLHSQPLPA